MFLTHLGLSSLHRNQVKTEYLMSIESSEILLEEIGTQALTTAAYQPPDTVLQAVDAVTLDNVVKVGAFIVKRWRYWSTSLNHHRFIFFTPSLHWCFAIYYQKFLKKQLHLSMFSH